MARGKLRPVNDSLNKPKTKFGIDYRILGGLLFVSVLAFLFVSKSASIAILIVAPIVGKIITMKDIKMLELWCMSVLHRAHYDPGKRA